MRPETRGKINFLIPRFIKSLFEPLIRKDPVLRESVHLAPNYPVNLSILGDLVGEVV